MSAYAALAEYYDILTRDVPYGKIADYYETLFDRCDNPVKTILDMACGTGTLTCLLAERDYEMIGTDQSPEMLAEAANKAASLSNRPMFINQPMESLDLYGTVDAVICSLDGINHVEPDKLSEVLHRVNLFLEPGGLFVFDILTPEALRCLDGEIFLDETDTVYCVWRAEFLAEQNACIYNMDIFTRDGSRWIRSEEEYAEYVYEPSELATLLSAEGFDAVTLYGDKTLVPPDGSERRVFLTAKKPK